MISEISIQKVKISSTSETGDMSDLALIAHLEFLKREILWDWLFCNFVRNKIYVLNKTRFQVGLMARKHTF